MDDGVGGDVAAFGVEPGIAVRIGEHASGALQDETGGGDVPNFQVQMPVGVHASGGHVADPQRG